MSDRLITVVETQEFQRRAASRMSDDEREAFSIHIAGSPEAGAIEAGAGGVRKVRWGVGSRGKSRGVRAIYHYHSMDMPLFLLTVFAKNERANLSQREKNELKRLTSVLVKEYQARRRHDPSRR